MFSLGTRPTVAICPNPEAVSKEHFQYTLGRGGEEPLQKVQLSGPKRNLQNQGHSPGRPLYQLLIHFPKYYAGPLSITALEWNFFLFSRDGESMHVSNLSGAC